MQSLKGSAEWKSQVLSTACDYFSNAESIHGFYISVKQQSTPGVRLKDISSFFKSDNPERSVALYAAPFLGPFATSNFCLMQAYCVTRPGSSETIDLNSAELSSEAEFCLFVKHLYVFSQLYEFLGEECRHDLSITDATYAQICSNMLDVPEPTSSLNEIGISTFATLSTTICDHFFLPDSTYLKMKSSSREENFGKAKENFHPKTIAKSIMSTQCLHIVIQNSKNHDKYLNTLKAVPIANFMMLMDDMKATQILYTQDIDDPETIVTFYWLQDYGEAKETILREQMEEGGVLKDSITRGLVSREKETTHILIDCVGGWPGFCPGDHIHYISCKVENKESWEDKTILALSKASRQLGLQSILCGKCIVDEEWSVLLHYTEEKWKSKGSMEVEWVNNPLNVGDDVAATCPKTYNCKVVAFNDGKSWH